MVPRTGAGSWHFCSPWPLMESNGLWFPMTCLLCGRDGDAGGPCFPSEEEPGQICTRLVFKTSGPWPGRRGGAVSHGPRERPFNPRTRYHTE